MNEDVMVFCEVYFSGISGSNWKRVDGTMSVLWSCA